MKTLKQITLTSMAVSVFLFFSVTSQASQANSKKKVSKEEEEEKIEFQTEVDPTIYAPKEFQKKSGYKTKTIPEPGKSLMPTKEEREAVFTKVDGLNSEISAYDELAKDLLFTRAKTRSINELAKIYTKISVETLTSLQIQIQESAKKK